MLASGSSNKFENANYEVQKGAFLSDICAKSQKYQVLWHVTFTASKCAHSNILDFLHFYQVPKLTII